VKRNDQYISTCNLPVARYIARKGPHIGEGFYRCPKARGIQCAFYKLESDSGNASDDGTSYTGTSASVSVSGRGVGSARPFQLRKTAQTEEELKSKQNVCQFARCIF